MTVQQQISGDDRVVAALVAGLEQEFGCRAGRALAEHFLEAEAADFHWDARCQERWVGAYDSLDEDEIELDRVAILGRLRGTWFVATCIVDGEGRAHGMTGRRSFATRAAAQAALCHVR